MPAELTKRTVKTKIDRIVSAKTGESLTVVILSPKCVVDCHAHIENGACAPLPLLWDKLPLQMKLERKTINTLAKIVKSKAGYLQVKSTMDIGKTVVKEIDGTFGEKSSIGQSESYKYVDLFACIVIQMMDMEYACLEGFIGKTIYREDKTPWYYYEHQSGKNLEKNRVEVKLPGENQKTFSKWKDQYLQTKDALKSNPLRLNAMYHYDPRRWNYPKTENLAGNLQKGPWEHPFSEIATKTNAGLFIGFKVYPPLGYKPLDERLPYLHDRLKEGDCFYARCEREGVPILSHCSPGGMSTHEMKLYAEFDGIELKPSVDETMPAETSKRLFTPEGYFWTNYVHPRAWREVLVRYPNLKLCLAHFGGDEWEREQGSDWITEIIALTKEYKNVYTDFSCWDLEKSKEAFANILTNKQHAHLRDKILFGTDWYMTLLRDKVTTYKKFCEGFWEFFQEIPEGMDLWQRFTFINPFAFYGFFDKEKGKDKLENLAAALNALDCDKKKLEDNMAKFRRIQKELEKIKESKEK
jgi:predicted TIM-barrel fold metal-dependent hydrolase